MKEKQGIKRHVTDGYLELLRNGRAAQLRRQWRVYHEVYIVPPCVLRRA